VSPLAHQHNLQPRHEQKRLLAAERESNGVFGLRLDVASSTIHDWAASLSSSQALCDSASVNDASNEGLTWALSAVACQAVSSTSQFASSSIPAPPVAETWKMVISGFSVRTRRSNSATSYGI